MQLHNELTQILLEQTDYHMPWIRESGGIEKTEEKLLFLFVAASRGSSWVYAPLTRLKEGKETARW